MKRFFDTTSFVLSVLIAGSFYIIAILDMRTDFKVRSFQEAHNGDRLLVPQLCKAAKGVELVDFIVENEVFDSLNSSDKMCWYTTPSFRTYFPPQQDAPDAVMVRAQYEKLGLELKPLRPWARLQSLIIPTFILLVLFYRYRFQKLGARGVK